MLFRSQDVFFLIPKRAFASPEQAAQFLALVSAGIDKGVENANVGRGFPVIPQENQHSQPRASVDLSGFNRFVRAPWSHPRPVYGPAKRRCFARNNKCDFRPPRAFIMQTLIPLSVSNCAAALRSP